MKLSETDKRAFDWIEKYSDGGELCIECPHSNPVYRNAHECRVKYPFDCPALPEDEFYK